MKRIKISRDKLLYACLVFLACAFAGWVFETIQAAVAGRPFISRGDLFVLRPLAHYFPALQNMPALGRIPLVLGLPLIEIYGIGGLVAVFGFRKLRYRPVLLFLTGSVALTLVELLGSYYCSFVLHKTYWDYSGKFLNFQGRICLESALSWGVGTILAVKVLDPRLSRFYQKHQGSRALRIVICILMTGVALCLLAKGIFGDRLS